MCTIAQRKCNTLVQPRPLRNTEYNRHATCSDAAHHAALRQATTRKHALAETQAMRRERYRQEYSKASGSMQHAARAARERCGEDVDVRVPLRRTCAELAEVAAAGRAPGHCGTCGMHATSDTQCNLGRAAVHTRTHHGSGGGRKAVSRSRSEPYVLRPHTGMGATGVLFGDEPKGRKFPEAFESFGRTRALRPPRTATASRWPRLASARPRPYLCVCVCVCARARACVLWRCSP